MATLEVRNLGKSYDENMVLQGIDFTVEPGESVAFMSPSGSGKSTLLSMLGLLLSPSEGEIILDGTELTALDDRAASELRLKRIGFVFQYTHLISSLRAVENVAVVADLAGSAGKEATERAEKLLCDFGLEERLYHYPHQLSVGQKRRIAVARALFMQPDILIADEPTNDLDALSSESVADVLFGHVREGGILLFATHDEALASRASRVMHLEGKRFV